ALYNMMLYERIEKLKNHNQSHYYPLYKTELDYIKEFEWLKEADSIALYQSSRNLIKNFSVYTNSLKKIKKGKEISLPQYKKKKKHNTYKTLFTNNNITIDFQNKKIKLPKLGFVSFRDKRKKGFGTIISVTVTRNSTGKYFSSILFVNDKVIVPKKKVKDPKKVIGLDMSLQNFYVDNEGDSPKFVRNTLRYEKRLTKAQRRLSKKQSKSKNWIKAKDKVSIIYEKIANSRAYFNQNLVYYLVQNYDAICIESLNLVEMGQTKKIGKSVQDVAYYKFIEKLIQKAEDYGTHIIQVNRYFASSKICSVCGYKYSELQLEERMWRCPTCETIHNRDVNAGINLRNYGLKKLGLL
ncbi:MAG: transposase, partial [Spirochaetia bacterium]|nr:transposase [Spirochaetia bacterium]